MIATIYAPWFGALPFYAGAFIHSCGCAPLVQWIIHSDQATPAGLPRNVKWIVEPDLTGRIRGLFYEAPQRVWGHKLCDLKPFWHVIFAELDTPQTLYTGWCDWDVLHNLSQLRFDFESAKFSVGSLCSPLFIFRKDCYVKAIPPNLARFLSSETLAWDELRYLPLYDSRIVQAGMTPGVDLIGRARYAVHMYFEKRAPHTFNHTLKRFCDFPIDHLLYYGETNIT